MLINILGWAFLVLAVWIIAALFVAMFMSRAVRVLEHRRRLPEDTRVHVRGQRLHIVTHVD